jgi:hypothetical protein
MKVCPMPKRWFGRTCALLSSIAILLASTLLLRANDPALAERLRREAPAKWAEYVSFAHKLQMSRHVYFGPIPVPGFVRRDSRTQHKQMSDQQLYVFEQTEPTIEGRCYARNDRYAFELQKGKEGWALVDLDTNPSKARGNLAVRSALTPDLVRAHCPFFVDGEWLPDLIKKPGFKIDKAQVLPAGQIRIDFRYTFEGQKKEQTYFDSGWFVVNPAQYWRLCEYEVNVSYRMGDRSVAHHVIECRLGAQGHPLRTREIVRARAKPVEGPEFESVKTTDFEVSEQEPSPAEFTLSAFGLPEPREFTPPSSPPRYYLWIAGMAGVLLVAALLFRRLAQRRAEPAKA